MKESERIREELKQAEEKLENVESDITKTEKKLAVLKKLKEDLGGSWYSRKGRIQDLKRQLASAELNEEDEKADIVVWKKPPFHDNNNLIVSRVTKKRIYVRQKGSRAETMYQRDTGLPVADWDGYGEINIQMTLGEIVDVQ